MNKISSTKRKLVNKFHEEKNEFATSFTNKGLLATISTNNNMHAASSM